MNPSFELESNNMNNFYEELKNKEDNASQCSESNSGANTRNKQPD